VASAIGRPLFASVTVPVRLSVSGSSSSLKKGASGHATRKTSIKSTEGIKIAFKRYNELERYV
jgi:hypothetical protein